jgi:uncharacterized protein (TIGR00730 family)
MSRKKDKRVVLPAYEDTLETYVARLRGSNMSADRKRKCALLFAQAVEAMDILSSTGRRTIAMMGSAQEPQGSAKFDRTVSIAEMLAPHYNIIQGEGPGHMAAAALGAVRGGAQAIGLRIVAEALYQQVSNAHTTLSVTFHNLFARKFAFLEADGYVFLDYGIGTLDEFTDVLANIQLGLLEQKPVVCVGMDTWRRVRSLLRQLAKEGRIRPEDLKLFSITDDPRKVVETMLKAAPPRLNGSVA